jgi:hypothetical protein
VFSFQQLESAQVFYLNLYKNWLAISSADDLLLALRHTFRSSSVIIHTLKTMFPANADGLDEYCLEGTNLPLDIHLDQGLEAVDKIMQDELPTHSEQTVVDTIPGQFDCT